MVRQNERQLNLDLLKGLAIICMVICHSVTSFAPTHPGYENEFLYILGDDIFGAYIVVAHGFMFAMGVGMAYSRKNTPADQIRRGIILLILAYVLNIARAGIFYLIYDIISGSGISNITIQDFLFPDIFHFVGLAFIVTGIFKKLKLKEIHILFIGMILSVIGTMIAFADTDNYVINMILGIFMPTQQGHFTFCFLSWYIFVAAGLLFGKIIQETEDKDLLYKRILIVSGVTALFYISGSSVFGMYFLTKAGEYYICSLMEASGLLAIDFALLSVFYFLLKKADASKLKFFFELSRNITSIYCI